MDLISIVVPIYNVEKYLERCVNSLVNQSYKNLEIILVDDGSPDGCPALCDELKQRDERIKVIHKENGGLSSARNAGLSEAAGAYITFIDSDDWIGEDHIEKLYTALKQNDCELAIGGYTAVYADSSQSFKSRLCSGVYNKERIKNEILLPLIGPEPEFRQDVKVESSSAMNLYKMSIIRDNGITFISERYTVAEDMYFNIDFLASANRTVVTEEIGYYYFDNPTSISRKYNPKRFERTVCFYSEMQKRLMQFELGDSVKQRINRTYLVKLRIALKHIALSELPYKEKILKIKEILNHEITVRVLKEYPINKFIFAIRMLTILMKKKMARSVLLFIKIREIGRGGALSRKLLGLIGIGKS